MATPPLDLSLKGKRSFTIIERDLKITPKFGLCRRSIVFKINDVPKDQDPSKWIEKGVREIISDITSEVRSEDRVGLTFTSENFDFPAYLSFKEVKHISFEDVWRMLQSIFQSKSEGLDTSKFRIVMTACRMPRGRKT